MKVAIIGAGAVGLTFASSLRNSGIFVDLYARREETKSLIESRGIKVSGSKWDLVCEPHSIHVITDLSLLSQFSYDAILIATKTTETSTIARAIAKAPSTHNTPLILLQNGWGMNEHYHSHPKGLIFNSYIPFGITRPRPNEVHINSAAGPALIGNISEGTSLAVINQICQASTNGGIEAKYSDQIVPAMWTKLLYNCTVNGLTYVFSIRNGALIESQFCQKMMESIVFEIFKVARMEKISLQWESEQQFIGKLYDLFIPITKDHISSMLQDRFAQQKTEVEFLNNAIVRLGEKHNLSCPSNCDLADLIRVIETSYSIS